MVMANTANQAMPYPLSSEKVADVNDHIRKLALAVEKQVVMKFATMTDMNTKIPVPVDGMMAYINDTDLLYLRIKGAWARVYPASPTIYSGTTAPASSLGQTGDIYIQG